MHKNEIKNIENISDSTIKESSYKSFSTSKIINASKKKLFFLPKIQNLKTIDFELERSKANIDNIELKKNEIQKNQFISSSEMSGLYSEKSSKQVNALEKKNLKFNLLLKKNNPKIKNLKFNMFLSPEKTIIDTKLNIYTTNTNTSKRYIKNFERNNLPKKTISPDLPMPKCFYRNRIFTKLKLQPLKTVIDKIINNNKDNNILKSTNCFSDLKVGCKYNPDNSKSMEEKEKIGFNGKIKNILDKINLNKNKPRNNHEKSCYEVLEYMRKKKKADCQRLIEKTSDKAKNYKKQIESDCSDFKKFFDNNDDEWYKAYNFYD